MDEKESINFLWEHYKMRQNHYWSSLNRFGLAILTVLVAPYLKPEIVGKLGNAVIMFPFIGFLLTFVSTWLLGAEYQRLAAVKRKYDESFPKDFRIEYPNDTLWQRLVGKNIGKTMTFVFGVGFAVLSLINFAVLVLTQISG